MNDAQIFAAVACLLISPLAGGGLAVLNTGLGRARNAAHFMMAALCVISVAAGMYFICGRALQGFAGGHGYFILLGGKPWDWSARSRGFFAVPAPQSLSSSRSSE
jgi:ammonia channel protein AmtB